MKNTDDTKQGVSSPARGDDVLESLFSHATTRTRPPEEDELAVRQALHSQWQDMVRRKSRRRNFAYGIAASIALAAVLSFQTFRQAGPGLETEQIANVSKQSGNIFVHQLNEQSGSSRRLSSNDLFIGQVLSTGQDARLAIEMKSGETIRVDENSRLAFISDHGIDLLAGQIYLDSNQSGTGASDDDALKVHTAAGAIEHLGTQYLVAISVSGIAISVREGSVRFFIDHSESIAHQGEQLQISPAGETAIIPFDTHGQAWSWTELVTPEYSLDGRSALEFIHWVGRETGRTVVFETDGSESLARMTELRGSIELEPIRALDLILQTSDLQPIIENGNIRIRKRMDS